MPIVLLHCTPETRWVTDDRPGATWPVLTSVSGTARRLRKACVWLVITMAFATPASFVQAQTNVQMSATPMIVAQATPAPAGTITYPSQGGWSAGVQSATPSNDGLTTTVIPNLPEGRTPQPLTQAELALTAFLASEADTGHRRPIDRGLVWRIFAIGDQDQNSKLINTIRQPTPTLQLPPGRYVVNAAYGRAYLTQILRLEAGRRYQEPFILNAGGLRVLIKVAGGNKLVTNAAHYDLYSDERDQAGERRRVVSNARPGLITRLNSGIYHIVSRLGDANALVSAEVAVEAGKLTEAVVSHEAAKVTLKLVQSAAGEAQADTEWILMTESGDVIKETAGALPTHVLAPGSYSVSARRGGRLYTRTFALKSGDNVEIEVMMQ